MIPLAPLHQHPTYTQKNESIQDIQKLISGIMTFM
jgi:hypothetical protein